MTTEEKQLLLQDLCARLPYDVKVWVKTHKGQIIESDFLTSCNGGGYYSTLSYEGILNDSVIKPYLRPLSSMTEEEKEDLMQEHLKDEKLYADCIKKSSEGDNSMRGKVIPHYASDWCIKNHYNYRLPEGLYIEAPEGMYNTKTETK